MAINKVVYGSNTLIDLTEDTVTAETLAAGATAHDRSGATIVGVLSGESIYHVSAIINQGTSVTFLSDEITSTMRVINCVFNSPGNVIGTVNWTTSDGSVVFTGKFNGVNVIDFDLAETNTLSVS